MKKQYIMYMIFAAICTAVNLTSQYFLRTFLSPIEVLRGAIFGIEFYFLIQITVGTWIGFYLKFVLDKIFVFKKKSKNLGQTVKQLGLYAVMATLTTFIYWGVEFSFKYMFSFENRDILGGFIGLAIGYTVKFFLDMNFVFKKEKTAEPAVMS
jgi:putative flippase GtrA